MKISPVLTPMFLLSLLDFTLTEIWKSLFILSRDLLPRHWFSPDCDPTLRLLLSFSWNLPVNPSTASSPVVSTTHTQTKKLLPLLLPLQPSYWQSLCFRLSLASDTLTASLPCHHQLDLPNSWTFTQFLPGWDFHRLHLSEKTLLLIQALPVRVCRRKA